jgi:hypothetical protein
MMKLLPALLFLTITHALFGQNATDTIAGEYHLQGVMETASAILLKPDHTFEIFFSYGAMDRQGSGKWALDQGKLILNSRPRPETDFSLVSSKMEADSFTTIKIVDQNTQILPHFEALLKTKDGEKYGKMNQEGIYKIPKTKTSAIELFFNFAPERYSSFPVQTDDNYFEFKIEPWIVEIFVENVALSLNKDGLTGEHPLLKGNAFSYVKMK